MNALPRELCISILERKPQTTAQVGQGRSIKQEGLDGAGMIFRGAESQVGEAFNIHSEISHLQPDQLPHEGLTKDAENRQPVKDTTINRQL